MTEYNEKAVGNVIRRLRKEKSLTQEVLSGFAGLGRSHLSMIESGAKKANFETLWKIANALEIKPHELVRQIETETEKLIDTQKGKI
ncbi:MAG: helix-turn-helix domain-containing protein [Acutalibacteraceae bacterium]